MEKMEMKKEYLPQLSLQELIYQKLSPMTNEDGEFIYDGEEPETERLGSNLKKLLDFAFNGGVEKPLDEHIFRDYLLKKLKVPQNELWNRNSSQSVFQQ